MILVGDFTGLAKARHDTFFFLFLHTVNYQYYVVGEKTVMLAQPQNRLHVLL